MSLELQHFRAVTRGGRYILARDDKNNPAGIEKARLSRLEVTCGLALNRGKWYGNARECEQNQQIRAAFLQLLIDEEGPSTVDMVCINLRMPGVLAKTNKPLTGRKIQAVFAEIDLCKNDPVRQNRRQVEIFLSIPKALTEPQAFSLQRSFEGARREMENDTMSLFDLRITAGDLADPKLRALVRREIEHRPAFNESLMSHADMCGPALQAIVRFGVERDVLWKVWALAQLVELTDLTRAIGALLKRVTRWAPSTGSQMSTAHQ